MANIIKIKTSTVPGKVPLARDLIVGELAVNTADGILYTKHSDNSVRSISSNSSPSNIYNGALKVTTNVTVVDSVPLTGNTNVRWFLNARDNVNNKFKSSTIDTLNDGSVVYYNEYGILNSDSTVEVAVFSSTVENGNVILYAIGNSANVDVQYQRITLGSSLSSGYISNVTTNSSANSASPYSGSYVLTGSTSNSTPIEIFINGNSGSRIPVSANATVLYNLDILAKGSNPLADYAAFSIKGMIANVSGTVSNVGSASQTVISRSSAGFDVVCSADNTNKSLSIYVTGANGKTMNWRAVVNTVES